MATNPNDRLVRTISLMDLTVGGHDGEAVNAFRAATSMLKAAGLSWRELAEKALSETPAPKAAGWADTFGAASGFEGIFADMARRSSAPGFFGGGTAQPRPRHRGRLMGVEVPAQVCGKVRIVDADRRSRNGAMLVLEIEGDEDTYGPLVCFSQALQADLRAALEADRPVMARIRPPQTATHMPTVTSANAF